MPDVDWIREFCFSFADVKEDMPWAEDLCFKVRGKIFVGLALSDGRFPRVTLKCSPEIVHELLEMEGIVRAPYVGRYNWIQIAHSNVLPARELEQLIRQSYELVSANAPRKPAPKKKSARIQPNRQKKK